MIRSRHLTLLLIFAALSGIIAAPAAGREQEEAGQGVFAEAIRVHLVNVEVYVSDADGRPVADLTADDFEILEDGRPVEITHFARIVDRRRFEPARGAVAVAPADEAPARGAPIEPTPPTEDRRLRLVVYFDNVNLRPVERKRVLDELRDFLHTAVGREDRVMLLSNDRALKVRQPFTSNPFVVSEALEEIDEARGEGGSFDRERRHLVARFDEYRSPEAALQEIRLYADSVYFTLNRSVDTLKELVEFLTGLPGRKAVLHVSSGLPMVAAAELFTAVERKFAAPSALSDLMNYDASRRFEELAALANASGITFYTLDAGGLRPSMAGAAENPGLVDHRVASYLHQDHQANLQDPLLFLADETGGRAIVNRNDVLPALHEIAADFDTYYSLGYSPDHFGTGHLYNLKVRVKRKGVRVRHRRSYRDKTPATRMQESTRAALLHAVGDDRWGLELSFGRAVRQTGERYLIPMQISIPVNRLVLLPRGTHHEASIRLFVAAMDDRGGLSAVEETPLGIRIPNDTVEAARDERWLYTHKLLMRSGRQSVAVAVRDELSSESAVTTRALVVGE